VSLIAQKFISQPISLESEICVVVKGLDKGEYTRGEKPKIVP